MTYPNGDDGCSKVAVILEGALVSNISAVNSDNDSSFTHIFFLALTSRKVKAIHSSPHSLLKKVAKMDETT